MTLPYERPSARVIVIDETGCALLFRIEDQHDPKPPLWITPGGGINPGEEPDEAAATRAWNHASRTHGPLEGETGR
jgi:8-oxo-dGTP pyrophosphatase MutT (NUDIX family)